MAEVEWPFESPETDPDWKYCTRNATFMHGSPDACEFIIHIGTDCQEKDSFFKNKLNDMKEAGCSRSFINTYAKVAELGAVRVLFYT